MIFENILKDKFKFFINIKSNVLNLSLMKNFQLKIKVICKE